MPCGSARGSAAKPRCRSGRVVDWLSLLSPEAAAVAASPALTDPAKTRRFLDALARKAGPPHVAVPTLEALLATLPEAADPEMALLNLERWTAGLATPGGTLALFREDPRLRGDIVRIFGSSQYLADILIRDPWLHSVFLEAPTPRSREDYQRIVEGALRPLRRPETRIDALRRVKRREFLRIGWRDLARGAGVEETIAEISDLADALIAGALQLAREAVAPRFATAGARVRFCVVALGKLGARELNYSSDVDLVFVMDSPAPHDDSHRRYATRLAETLIQTLSQETGEGRCFRVDMRLRPEGRSGALVRSLGAFREYYDRWAETWERQALIKARPVAGDTELGGRFMELVRPVVYRRLQGAALLEDVREMRTAVERKLEAEGGLDGHVKEGRGTLREVEFPVQLLQLLFGADRPALQVADTLTALVRLEEEGLLTPEERLTFESGYRFFRVVEHRLQTLHDLPVRRLPSEPADLRRLARSTPRPEYLLHPVGERPVCFDDVQEFIEVFRSQAEGVHALAQEIHQRLGIRTGAEGDDFRSAVLTADTPEGETALRAEWVRRGFPDPEAAMASLVRLASGSSQYRHPSATRRLFADLAPALLEACAGAADPAWALEGMADFSDRKVLHRALYRSLIEQPDSLRALTCFAGTAPAAMRTVLRFPEWSDLVTDREQLQRRRPCEELAGDLQARLAADGGYERRLSILRRFKMREWVRLAARCVLERPPAEAVTAEWADVADVLVAAALELAVVHARTTGRWRQAGSAGLGVFALGRLGGRNLHFASDLDLLYVYAPTEGVSHQEHEALVRTFGEVLSRTTEEGRLFETDLRLRPEGRQGSPVVSLEAVRRYYGPEGRAQTWEFQALTRLRFVAGSDRTAAQLQEHLTLRIYRTPMPAGWKEEIRTMRLRMERERVSAADRPHHLKLGPGGMADVEFLVQFLQLRHGSAYPELRGTRTLQVLESLRDAGLLEEADFRTCREGYLLLTRLRQSLTLLAPDRGSDLQPAPEREPRLAAALARSLDFPSTAALEAAYRDATHRVREVFHRHFGA